MKHQVPYDRAVRLADAIYRVVSEVCYTELSDPRLAGIQITQVRMTKDLRTARVYFHLVDAAPEAIEGITKALRSAQGFFKRAIADAIPIKYMPVFDFFYDETMDVREHVDALFEDLEKKREYGGQ